MNIRNYLILASLVAVTACGISGPLEKAAPMWGADRAAYEAEQAKLEAERKAKAAERAAQNPAPAPAPAPKS